MKTINFKSCYIVNVSINEKEILLSDSCNHTYHINKQNNELLNEFKIWFKQIFSKGIAQTLTIFQYEIIDISECECEIHIVKFLLKTDSKTETVAYNINI